MRQVHELIPWPNKKYRASEYVEKRKPWSGHTFNLFRFFFIVSLRLNLTHSHHNVTKHYLHTKARMIRGQI